MAGDTSAGDLHTAGSRFTSACRLGIGRSHQGRDPPQWRAALRPPPHASHSGAVLLAALLLFESLAARDLRIFAQALHADVSHYRDATGLEADAVVERRDRTWAAFEVKLGPGAVDEAARSLLRLADRVDSARHGRPAALVVLTGWGYGYRRPDGVCVVPIGSLGP